MNLNANNIIRYILAGLTFFGAGVILIAFGLPDRLDYVGVKQGEFIIAPEAGAYAPPVNGETLDSVSITWAELRGKPVIINFWATWCAPCRVEMPELQNLHEQFPDDLHIIGVNLNETPAQIATWVEEFSLTFDILPDDGRLADAYRLRSPPSTFIVDPEGVVSAVFYGPVTANQLLNSITPFLSAE